MVEADEVKVILPVPEVNAKAVAPVSLPIVIVLATPPVPILMSLDSVVFVPIPIEPDVVLIVTAPSPSVISSAAPAPIYVFNLDIAHFLFVPAPPSSTINKSSSANAAPISVPPSISKLSILKAPAAAPTYVLILDIAHFLFVPLAPSSITNKSASDNPAPISVPPSISKHLTSTKKYDILN